MTISAVTIADLHRLVSLIDLTTLEGSDTPESVARLARIAMDPGQGRLAPPPPPVAAVCVYPLLVQPVCEVLDDSPVRVATVAGGFPSAQYSLDVRIADLRAAIQTGADEIDIVINRGHVLARDDAALKHEVHAMHDECRQSESVKAVKFILETGELPEAKVIRRACDAVIEAVSLSAGDFALKDGEVFLKTSTGKIGRGATAETVRILAESALAQDRATGVKIGIKPSGGIRTVECAIELINAIASVLGEEWIESSLVRIGASSLLNDICRRLTHADS